LFDDAGRSRLVRAEGSQVQVVDYEHPFAAFVSAQLANVSYRAEASPAGLDGIRVFARSAGGAAVGFEMPTGTGRVIVVPALKAAPAGDKRYAASDVLQAGIRRALDVEAAGRAPLWVPAYEPLPGFAGRATALREAQERAEAAKREVSKAEAAHAEQAQFQRLLWQEGAIGLEPVVLEALRRLRFEVHDRDANALEVRCPEGDALIEIEASEHPVDMAAHHRLRQRIERAIERRGSAPRGILFVNGQRLVTPSERQHVSPSLLTAAETMRYCIVPTPRLYDALVRDMSGDDDAAASFRRSLMATDGLLS
jgi:hypothetical protein